MRTSSVLALVAWAVMLPGVMRAGDVTFSFDGSTEYDSNVYRSSSNEKDDMLFRFRPAVRLHDDRGQDLRYSLQYAIPIELAVTYSDLNDVDQDVIGDFNYHATDQLSIYGSNSFRYLRSELQTNFEGTDSPNSGLLINDERERVTMNDAVLGTSYQFTPRLEGTLQLEHNYFNPSRDDRAKNWQLEGVADLAYTLTPKHRVGGGVMAAHQAFDETQDITASTSEIYQVFGTWRWSINEITELFISAGPSVIVTEQDDPPGSETRGIVPFSKVNSSFNAPGGYVDRNGAPIPQGTEFPSGSLLVGRFSTCQQLQTSSGNVPVLTSGESCPLNVILDATQFADDDLIAQIESQANQVTLFNPDPDGDNSTDVTGFAQVVLTRHWTPNLHSALRYAREQGNGSGLGGTVVGDSITLSNTWDITEKWQLALRGEWGLRKSVSESTRTQTVAAQVTSPLGGVPFGVDLAGVSPAVGINGALITQRSDETNIDTQRWGLAGRGTYFFRRNTSGYVQLTYNEQSSASDSLGDPSDFNDFLATVGITHVFEPIKLW
ncbi:MAG TPA: hypothetical protein VFT55_01165 [Planctomycetota bacterium]|nr:hypothetical protein [Planctomycetota bacterium]